MQPDEFPPNNDASKREPEDKRVNRIISSDVIRKKTSLRKRFTETFFEGDLKSAIGYGIFDILLPSARDMVVDVVNGSVEKLFMGDSRRRGSTPPQTGPLGHILYNRMSGGSRMASQQRVMSRQSRSRHNFDELILASRGEAEEVIDKLFEVVDKYGTASVADLYELVGLASNHTDHTWGWTDLRGAGVSRDRDGYLLDLPDPSPLQRIR